MSRPRFESSMSRIQVQGNTTTPGCSVRLYNRKESCLIVHLTAAMCTAKLNFVGKPVDIQRGIITFVYSFLISFIPLSCSLLSPLKQWTVSSLYFRCHSFLNRTPTCVNTWKLLRGETDVLHAHTQVTQTHTCSHKSFMYYVQGRTSYIHGAEFTVQRAAASIRVTEVRVQSRLSTISEFLPISLCKRRSVL
jgi:hypothetical protein